MICEKNQLLKKSVVLMILWSKSDWEKATMIVREDRWFPRKVREALEIQYHNSEPENGGMNLDAGSYVKTNFWKPMF